MKRIAAIILFLSVCIVSVASAADEIVVGTGASSLSIKPSTAGDCTVTSVERFKRQFRFNHDYEAKSYYLITQTAEVGQGC